MIILLSFKIQFDMICWSFFNDILVCLDMSFFFGDII